jgi:hypothetical protein
MSLKKAKDFAIKRMTSLGMDAQWLIEKHSSQLKTIRLNADMGNEVITRDANNAGDPLDLKSVAVFVIAKACDWPYQDEIYGIDMEPALKLAAVDYLTNERWFSLSLTNNLSRSVTYGIATTREDGLCRMSSITNLLDSVYITALERNGLQLKDVPPERRTQEMEYAAVKSNGNAIKYVDKAWRTPEMLKLAVESNGSALAYMDTDEITHDLAEMAIGTTPLAACNVPHAVMTRSLVMQAVSLDGMLLNELSLNLVDREVAQACVKQTAMALLVCPEKFMDAAMLRLACKYHPEIKMEQWVKDIASGMPKQLPVSTS